MRIAAEKSIHKTSSSDIVNESAKKFLVRKIKLQIPPAFEVFNLQKWLFDKLVIWQISFDLKIACYIKSFKSMSEYKIGLGVYI